jgi:hypothetical protein
VVCCPKLTQPSCHSLVLIPMEVVCCAPVNSLYKQVLWNWDQILPTSYENLLLLDHGGLFSKREWRPDSWAGQRTWKHP